MTHGTRKVVLNIFAFVFAGVLLYLALKDVDFSAMGSALKEANYWWLIPLLVVILFTHFLRAYRWQLQLEGLPGDDEKKPVKVSLATAYISVWIGYMVNTAIPRLGEIARCANLARRENLSLSAVVGSVVVERILDLIILALTVGISLVILLERPAIMDRYVFGPAQRLAESVTPLAIVLVVIGLAVMMAAAFLIIRKLRRHEPTEKGGIIDRIVALLRSFRDGMMTLVRSKKRISIVVLTILIWIGYWVMVHLPFYILGQVEPNHITIADSFIVLTFGTIGFALFPSPGGTGSYHYVTIQTLVYILGMNETDAATYAVVNHAALTLLNIIMGVLCLGIQGTGWGELQAEVEADSQLLEESE